MIRRILVALFLSLFAVPARPMTDAEIRDCLDFDECALVSRPTKTIGLILALLIVVFGGCGTYEYDCAGSLPPDPEERVFGSYMLPCGAFVEVSEGDADWTGTTAWGTEICAMISRVSEIAGQNIDPSTITLYMTPVVTWKGADVFGVTIKSGDRFFVHVRATADRGCCANTSLGHELLHVALNGDGNHLSGLWATILTDSSSCDLCAHTFSARSM